jgi:protein-S-isoprenylcysteine O-methyltransferase Ste14
MPAFRENGMWAGVVLGYHLASRLAYVIGIGVALSRQHRHRIFTRTSGEAEGFRRFRRRAAFLLNNDAVSFVLLSLVTRNTLGPTLSVPVRVALGLVMIILGIGVKYWAALRLGPGAYYWENFFIPKPIVPLDPPGPYRYLRNPMYTVGYLHAYGFALLCGSWLGLVAAAFDQIAILIFHNRVEKPHFLALMSDRPDATS